MTDESPLGAVIDKAPVSAADAVAASPFLESGDLVGDGAALRRRFAEEGYLFVRNVLDRDLVLETRAKTLAALHKLGWLAEAGEAFPRPGFATHLGKEDFWSGITEMLRLREMHQLAFGPKLGVIMDGLFGREFFAHPRRFPRIKFPAVVDDFSETFAHQDFPYTQGTLDTVTVWMPLGDCTQAEGALQVLSGSHLSGVVPLITGPGFPCTASVVDNDDPRWRGADFAAGDIVLFSSLTVHRTRPNGGERVRISVDCRFQPISEPACESALAPGYTPDVPPWHELLEPEDSWLYEVPDSVPLVPFSPPERRPALPASTTCFPWLIPAVD